MESQFVQYWNNTLVPYWDQFRHLLSGNGDIHSHHAWPDFDIQAGEKILDVGCGYGETCLDMSHFVTLEGQVTGIDCTRSFIQTAEYERNRSQASNVNYLVGDAQNYPFEKAHFDMAFSRFGVMFFENSVAALKNIYQSLKPGGRLCLIVWGTIDENPCWNLAKKVALNHLPPPPDDADSCGPGPFSMGDPNVTTAKLKSAGFTHIESYRRIEADICMGRNLQEALAYQTEIGPCGEIVYVAGEQGKQQLPAIKDELGNALKPFKQTDGYYLPSTSYAIVARKPRH